MDADLIRLILLALGACLVVGIWLWDRWQRDRGEPPMVRLREPEQEDDQEDQDDWQAADASAHDRPDDDDEPATADEPDQDSEELEPSVLLEQLEVDSDSELVDEPAPVAPATSKPRREPVWLQADEPVIPAFLMSADHGQSPSLDELQATGDDAADSEPPPTAELPDLTTKESPPEAIPEQTAPTLTARRHDRADDQASAGDPRLDMGADDEPELPVLELAPEPAQAPPRPRKAKEPTPKPEAEPVSIRADDDQFDLDLGFSAVDDQDLQEVAVDLPDLIVQINIVAKGEPFSGEQILAAMDQVEMRAGEHDIYHRYDNRAAKGKKPKILFSLASLVEPGNFPLKKMKSFSSPGLTLFAQLPGPRDGLLIYSDMLYVAERLARLLDARLKDDSRSTLTRQTIEHTRERIAEHKRQITLKLRQAGDQQRGRR